MKIIFYFILFFTLVQIESLGQSTKQTTSQKLEKRAHVDYLDSVRREKGEINIIQDKRIDELDELRKTYPGTLNGYRVQVFFGRRELAIEKKAEFIESNPGVPTYISFLAPNFRLRVGDFRSRIEAEKLKYQIEKDYPGCYIVKDQIELPPLDKGQLDLVKTDSLQTKTEYISAD